jgi:insertion element IS1 protein InsB
MRCWPRLKGRKQSPIYPLLHLVLETALYNHLKCFNIKKYYTDDWGSYSKYLPPEQHIIGKQNTQQIENKNLNFRTRIKRLARKTICFSKLELLHDTVIGLFINRYCFQPL